MLDAGNDTTYMFGEESDCDDEDFESNKVFNALWITLARFGLASRNFTKSTDSNLKNDTRVESIDRKILILVNDEFLEDDKLKAFIGNHKGANFTPKVEGLNQNRVMSPMFDVIIFIDDGVFNNSEDCGNASFETARHVASYLVTGLSLLIGITNKETVKLLMNEVNSNVSLSGFYLDDVWRCEHHDHNHADVGSKFDIVMLLLEDIKVNDRAALYWGKDKSHNLGASGPPEDRQSQYMGFSDEVNRVESVTVRTCIEERRGKTLSSHNFDRAVNILKEHGVLILPGLFDSQAVLSYGAAALKDMEKAVVKLREADIDLLRPGNGPRIENYHELGMREALRCDLRNGEAMKAADCSKLRHPVIEAIIAEAMYTPASFTTAYPPFKGEEILAVNEDKAKERAKLAARGNWGLWNFEGPGPNGPRPALRVGDFGCVMSLPGCVDQTIHADTPHLFTHTQLPGHYYNLFLIAAEKDKPAADMSCGQTVFIQGSHNLEVTQDIMDGYGGQAELVRRLLRPHLVAGDALVFDCRILHCGLANNSGLVAPLNEHPSKSSFRRFDAGGIEEEGSPPRSSSSSSSSSEGGGTCTPRPLLYCNYTREFFSDPKNWNDKERLFA